MECQFGLKVSRVSKVTFGSSFRSDDLTIHDIWWSLIVCLATDANGAKTMRDQARGHRGSHRRY